MTIKVLNIQILHLKIESIHQILQFKEAKKREERIKTKTGIANILLLINNFFNGTTHILKNC